MFNPMFIVPTCEHQMYSTEIGLCRRFEIVNKFSDLKQALDFAEKAATRQNSKVVVYQAIRSVAPTITITVTEL